MNTAYLQSINNIRSLVTPLQLEPSGIHSTTYKIHDIKAVLFDIHGTLTVCNKINPQTQRASLENAFNETLKHFKIKKPITYSDFEKEIAISKNRCCILFPEVNIYHVWKKLLQLSDKQTQAVSFYFEFKTNPIWPMPSAHEVLKKLKELRIPIGIISDAQFFTIPLLEHVFQSSLKSLGFKEDLLTLSYKFKESKPSTRLFADSLQKLRTEYKIYPHNILYIGNDMLEDIDPARKLGMRTALFAGDRNSLQLRENDPRIKNTKPDSIITDFTQILDLVA